MSETPEKFFQKLEKFKNIAVEDQPNHPSDVKPDWFDAQLFAKGQTFIKENYVSICLSELASLHILFLFREILDALIFTRQSDTIERASRRYYDTIMRVKSWYEEDPWDPTSEAYKNIVVVRSLHSSTSRKLNSKGKYLVKKELEDIKAKWNGGCPVVYLDKTPNSRYSDRLSFFDHSDKYITQPEMTLTLFTFMGLTLLFPQKFGIFNATKEAQTAYIHFWRTIGYLLGIEDEINFCRGTVDEVKARCRAFLNLTVIPKMHELNTNWEHMSKCMELGIQKFLRLIDYETSLMYLFWVLEVKCDQFKKTVRVWIRVKFLTLLFILKYLQRIAMFRNYVISSVQNGLAAFGKSRKYKQLKDLCK